MGLVFVTGLLELSSTNSDTGTGEMSLFGHIFLFLEPTNSPTVGEEGEDEEDEEE